MLGDLGGELLLDRREQLAHQGLDLGRQLVREPVAVQTRARHGDLDGMRAILVAAHAQQGVAHDHADARGQRHQLVVQDPPELGRALAGLDRDQGQVARELQTTIHDRAHGAAQAVLEHVEQDLAHGLLGREVAQGLDQPHVLGVQGLVRGGLDQVAALLAHLDGHVLDAEAVVAEGELVGAIGDRDAVVLADALQPPVPGDRVVHGGLSGGHDLDLAVLVVGDDELHAEHEILDLHGRAELGSCHLHLPPVAFWVVPGPQSGWIKIIEKLFSVNFPIDNRPVS